VTPKAVRGGPRFRKTRVLIGYNCTLLGNLVSRRRVDVAATGWSIRSPNTATPRVARSPA